MAKGKKKKQAQKEAAMDADDAGGWMTGPISDAEEQMDTREAGTGAGPAVAAAPALGLGAASFGKQRPGPRGKRTTAQKKRKMAKLERALAVADRIDAKAGHREASRASKKSMKKLWQNEGTGNKGL